MSFKRMPIEHDDWKIVFFFLENSWEITEPLKIFFFLFIEILNKRNTCSNIKKNRNNEWTYTHTHAHWRWYKIRFHFDLKKYVKGKQNPSSLFLNNKKICVYWRFFFFFFFILHINSLPTQTQMDGIIEWIFNHTTLLIPIEKYIKKGM